MQIKIQIKPSTIKENLHFFIDACIEDPKFDSQTKVCLKSKVNTFGSQCLISDGFIKALVSTGLVETVIEMSKAKEMNALKSISGKKTAKLKGLPKLQDADLAGSRRSSECTLILTEGSSAKAFAIHGISVLENGYDYYGAFELKGKLLNVRTATAKQLKENEEIKNIVQIMGLKYNKDYADVSSLRYGRILILSDQDLDGFHIKGLVMNFIQYHFPSLAKIPGFISSLNTPLLRLWKKSDVKRKNPVIFFSMQEFDVWKQSNNINDYEAKYYKGLGTSSDAEIAESFKYIEQKLIKYGGDPEILLLPFSKDAKPRKQWLINYNKNASIPSDQQDVTYHEFVHKELIHFSTYDNVRSIPSLCDGLKVSQRKILYSCFKRNLVKEIRVAQLAGYISENAAYHHGEASLQYAIIAMAQTFIGSNNLPLLVELGQFGNRMEGGKNHASARYINTHLSKLSGLIFRKADKNILIPTFDDDNNCVEPETYCPIICMALINGANGIGTGFSTQVLNYNPLDVLKNTRNLINGDPVIEMQPWYRKFKGKIVKNGNYNYDTHGIYEIVNEDTVVISELPIGYWTVDYNKFLDTVTADDVSKPDKGHILRSWSSKCGTNTIHYTLTFLNGMLHKMIKNNSIDKDLDLIKKLHTTNMHLYDENGVLCKYDNVNDIMVDHYKYRLKMYDERKKYIIKELEHELNIIAYKIMFIEYYNVKKIVFKDGDRSLKEVEIIVQLETHKFPKLSHSFDDPESKRTYNYLTGIKIFDLTYENMEKLKKEHEEKKLELEMYIKVPVQQIWLNELVEVEKEYLKYIEENVGDSDDKDAPKKKKGRQPKKVVKK